MSTVEQQGAAVLFKRTYGHAPPHTVLAPGRLELLGNHTDYNEGLVLALAVNKYVTMTGSPRQDGRINLISSAFPEKETFAAGHFDKAGEVRWIDYVKGVLSELRKRDIPFGGFDAAVYSTIPMGAGLSSSAALEVATALLVRRMYPYALTDTGRTEPPARDKQGALPELKPPEKLSMARLCQAAENNFVGVKCGLLDQIACLFGKAFHTLQIDFQDLGVEHAPLLGEISVIVCQTGVRHELAAGAYNELRGLCESGARALGVKALRRVDLPMLKANKDRLTLREYECAYHVVGEIQRVVHGVRALADHDWEQFGQFMFQSHESSRDFFKNSTEELDLLVDLALREDGCFGARLTGGGFGGATINLVRHDRMKAFCRSIEEKYRARTGLEAAPLVCQVVDGAK